MTLESKKKTGETRSDGKTTTALEDMLIPRVALVDHPGNREKDGPPRTFLVIKREGAMPEGESVVEQTDGSLTTATATATPPGSPEGTGSGGAAKMEHSLPPAAKAGLDKGLTDLIEAAMKLKNSVTEAAEKEGAAIPAEITRALAALRDMTISLREKYPAPAPKPEAPKPEAPKPMEGKAGHQTEEEKEKERKEKEERERAERERAAQAKSESATPPAEDPRFAALASQIGKVADAVAKQGEVLASIAKSAPPSKALEPDAGSVSKSGAAASEIGRPAAYLSHIDIGEDPEKVLARREPWED